MGVWDDTHLFVGFFPYGCAKYCWTVGLVVVGVGVV